MKNVVVVYAGGFQPFHQGHLASYLQAKNAFPEADFYVAASADTKKRPIPYPEKKFLAVQAGVQPQDFPNVIVKSPLKPDEILKDYNPEEDVFVLVRSERDPMSYTKKDGTPGYYQPWQGLDKAEPFGKHGYVFVTPKHDFAVNGEEVYSGTQVRNLYAKADDKGRNTIIKQLYPQSKDKKTIKNILDTYIGEEMVSEVNKIFEYIHRIKPYLEEASEEQKTKIYKLLSEAKRKIEEGQIYSTGGGSGQAYHWTTPRHVPNQHELQQTHEDSMLGNVLRGAAKGAAYGLLPAGATALLGAVFFPAGALFGGAMALSSALGAFRAANKKIRKDRPIFKVSYKGKNFDEKKHTYDEAIKIISNHSQFNTDLDGYYYIYDTEKDDVVWSFRILDTLQKENIDYLEE